MAQQVYDAELRPVGYQQLTGITPATKLTLPAGKTPKIAIIQAEAQDVRWRDDGVAPTAAVGMLLKANADMVYTGDLANIQFILVVAGAIVNVSYYEAS